MKDNELRAIVLQKYYDLRRRGTFQWCEVELDDHFPIKEFSELGRICDQLAEHGLIHWQPTRSLGQPIGGFGNITAFGVDVIEGTAKSPIAITFDHSQTVTLHDSPNAKVQVGNNNSASDAWVGADLIRAIDHSGFSTSEKTEAKSIWTKVCENKLLNTVLGSVSKAATERLLGSETHVGHK